MPSSAAISASGTVAAGPARCAEGYQATTASTRAQLAATPPAGSHHARRPRDRVASAACRDWFRRDSVAASNDFEAHGLQRSGDRWETPGFATAAVRITLEVDANAASLSLDPAGPCAG